MNNVITLSQIWIAYTTVLYFNKNKVIIIIIKVLVLFLQTKVLIVKFVPGTCIKCLLKERSTGVIRRGELMEKCLQLCEIMQYEFIFTKTCQTLETSISEVMDSFLVAEILVPQQVCLELTILLSKVDRSCYFHGRH